MKNYAEYNALGNFINNNINNKKGYFWVQGYKIFGPLLYSYVKWLEENLEKENYNNIYFLSRDGYIMQKAFEIVNSNIETKYLYASRRALTVPILWMYDSLEDLLEIMFWSKNISIKAFLKKVGLNPENYEKVVKKYGYKLNQIINIHNEKNIENFKLLYKELKKDIDKNSKEEYKNLINYLKSVEFNGKVAIIDIGWFGNMQNAIQKVLENSDMNAEVNGFYVGVAPSSDKQDYLKMQGFLFEKNKNEKLFWKKKFFNGIFEMVFMANHGSVKRYSKNTVELYDFEYENTDTEKKIKEFQEGALQFVTDYNNFDEKKYERFSEYTSMKNFLDFANIPKNRDINMFKDIKFYDDDFYDIIPKDISIKYIFKPKKLISGFQKSVWKTAFLKKIFKIRLNYYKVIMFLQKILKKGDN